LYAAGIEPRPAIAMSLTVVGVTSAIGSVPQWRCGNVQSRVALLFGLFAMACALVGARLAVVLPGVAALVVYANRALLIGAAWWFPAWPSGYGTGVAMTDDQVASVATCVRSSFCNNGSAVTAAEVARVREETNSRTTPWTVAELESIK